MQATCSQGQWANVYPDRVTGPGAVRVQIRNTTTTTLTVYDDAQLLPMWLHIGNPELLLNGYGWDFCGPPGPNHNDPFPRTVQIAPGGSHEYLWDAHHMEQVAGPHWQEHFVTPGTYPARACAYEGTPDPMFHPPFPSGSGAPTIAEDAGVPEKCVTLTLTIPVGGQPATVVASF